MAVDFLNGGHFSSGKCDLLLPQGWLARNTFVGASQLWPGAMAGYVELGGCVAKHALIVPAWYSGGVVYLDFFVGSNKTCGSVFTVARNGKSFRAATLDEATAILIFNAGAREFSTGGVKQTQPISFSAGGIANASNGSFQFPSTRKFDRTSDTTPAGPGYPTICIAD